MAIPQPLTRAQEQRLAYLENINADYDDSLNDERSELFAQKQKYEEYEKLQAQENTLAATQKILEEIKAEFIEAADAFSNTPDENSFNLLLELLKESLNVLEKSAIAEKDFNSLLCDVTSEYYRIFSIMVERGSRTAANGSFIPPSAELKKFIADLSFPLLDFFLNYYDFSNPNQDTNDLFKIIIGFYSGVSSLEDYIVFAVNAFEHMQDRDHIELLLTGLIIKLKDIFKDNQDDIDKFRDILASQSNDLIILTFDIFEKILDFCKQTRNNPQDLLLKFIREITKTPNGNVPGYIEDVDFILRNLSVHLDGDEHSVFINELKVGTNLPLEKVIDDASVRETWKKEITACTQLADLTTVHENDNKWQKDFRETCKFYFNNTVKLLLNSDDESKSQISDKLAQMSAVFSFILDFFETLTKLGSQFLLRSFESSVNHFFKRITNDGSGYNISTATDTLLLEMEKAAAKSKESKSTRSFHTSANITNYEKQLAAKTSKLRTETDIPIAGPSAAASSAPEISS